MKEQKEVLLSVQHLKKYFHVGKNAILKAVDDVSFDIYKGETLGMVGESGCGKTTLLRAVAKNCRDVSVIVDPADYDQVLAELSEHGNTLLTTRFRLARKVFALTAAYDAAISRYLETIDPATEASLAEAGRDA